MKITAVITPEEFINLDRLELEIERWLSKVDPRKVYVIQQNMNQAIYLTLEGVDDEWAARMREILKGAWGGVKAEILWL